MPLKNRKTIVVLAMLVLAQMVFLKVSFDHSVHGFFPLSAAKCTAQEYVYYMFEHLTIVCLMWIICMESPSVEMNIFLLVFIGDLIDYLLTYNSQWFTVMGVSVSYNVVQAVCVGYLVIKAAVTGDE